MALSWNEIKERASRFSKEWETEVSEDAEAKSFWDEFFNVFGISRRRVASFETRVTKENRKDGFIDLLWKGQLLIEHKSGGKDLNRAYKQALDYFPGLKEYELPKYIIVCNFQHFRLYDLEEGTQNDFALKDLIKHVTLFGFIAGYQKKTYKEGDPVNIKAAELMGKLHDQLKAAGYEGHDLEVFLVRLLFCLFADDTTIFENGTFKEFIEEKTREDGSDMGALLASLFDVLNIPDDKRMRNMDETLAAFPYVNGKLFEERLPVASFDAKMRNALLECSALNWGTISPAIFGSLFQSVMNPDERRNLGAHYTSEKNILKLIKPLFMDDLWAEFEGVKGNLNKLQRFHDKISELSFLDPACGCGNFLIIAYRELRLLEIEIIKTLLYKHLKLRKEVAADARMNLFNLLKCDVNKFYGIEYEEFPAQIAQVAMWLIDHQMNMKVSEIFGEYYRRLPLVKAASIKKGNALQIDWQSLIDPIPWEKKEPRFDFIFGNPPFIGSKLMKQEQRDSIVQLFEGREGSGVLDYVTGWYIIAAQYIQNSNTQVAFVSTNSIVQGEQTSILWGYLINKFDIKIHFAHRTFKWSNEAKGNAAVYCVIIGFISKMELTYSGKKSFDGSVVYGKKKRLFEYETPTSEPHEIIVNNINPYLVDAKDLLIYVRSNPICNVPKMSFGNMPLDGGHLIMSDDEKKAFLLSEPEALKYIKPLISAHEFLNGKKRWCLWLVDVNPKELRSMPQVLKRIELVKKFRLESKAPSTQKHATTPSLFRDRNQPNAFIVIPRVSSENRSYIPMGFFDKKSIVSDTCMSIPNGTIFHFGVLTSIMHMIWVKNVCGRLKSDFRYSKDIVYNNFPWPKAATQKQIGAVEEFAQKVLDTRKQFPESSLADLYDPSTMPSTLVEAHQQLDKAVDLCYRSQPFSSETKRIEFLFELYEEYTAGMFGKKKKEKKLTQDHEGNCSKFFINY